MPAPRPKHAGDPRDPLAGPGASREADLAHARIGAQRVPELAPGAGDARDRLRVQSGLEEDLGERERREGRLPRGLEDDRVACGERGRDLVQDEEEGEVEGRDRDDDAAGLAQREPEAPETAVRGGVERQAVAVELGALEARRAQDVAGACGFGRRLGDRLAALARDRPRERVDALVGDVAGPSEDRLAVVPRGPALMLPATDRRGERAIDVGDAGHGNRVDHFCVEWGAQLLLLCAWTHAPATNVRMAGPPTVLACSGC
jgi:hypothetical protein